MVSSDAFGLGMNDGSINRPTDRPTDQFPPHAHTHTTQPTVGARCATFAEPAWPRTMSLLGSPRKCREEMVELACRAVACPAHCLDQVRESRLRR